ncbi:MAG: hypothetical protein ABSB40_03250 [Nitrososphaeria archaeon]|jgi:hypothetical protein
MGRSPDILKFVDSAANGIKSVEEQVMAGTPVKDLEKELWAVYRDCESAVFLVKLEISDVEFSDNTSTRIDIDHMEQTISLAGDQLVNVLRFMGEGKMIQALEQLRSARNIMAEVYARAKRENLRAIRESRKSKDKKA